MQSFHSIQRKLVMNASLLILCFIMLHQFGVVNLTEFYECGLSEKDKKSALDAHNKYRLRIANGLVENQPRGVNLKRMSWDAKLATAAQELAATGVFEHDVKPDGRFQVGQNLYMSMSTAKTSEIDWANAVLDWFQEHEDFNYETGAHTGTVGHYTQVIWADTNLVGCGYCSFKNKGDKYPYQQLYVCNYGPTGNWIGLRPYKTGTNGCEKLC